MNPNWNNSHAEDCPVAVARVDLWRSLNLRPTDEGLLGAMPEYDNGGDREAELCTCYAHGEQVPGQAGALGVMARTTAQVLRAFANLVAEDTNTHDGNPRGYAWQEDHPRYASCTSLQTEAQRLYNLADLWERG